MHNPLLRAPDVRKFARNNPERHEKMKKVLRNDRAKLDFLDRIETVPMRYASEISYEATQENDANKSELRDVISKVLNSKYITSREKYILRKRFGIGVNNEYTLEEIAKELKLSAPYIRQLEQKAFRKLKRPNSYSRQLRSFLNT
jgi:RNA polymerase sigma factor (sigma-70 family)